MYGFPLLMMDLTKEAPRTAVPTVGEFTAPINQFSVMTHYPDMSFRAVPLVIRNFWPKAAALDGTYKTPPTRKTQ